MIGGESVVDLLLVEDNVDDARYIERLVETHRAGLEPTERPPIEVSRIEHVDRLAAGLERLQEWTPDVILLDLMLPDSRGSETVQTVVEHAPTVPIVVLTGRDDTAVGVEAIRLGAEDYLIKASVTDEVLLRTLRYAVERKRNQRELLDRNHRLALLNRIVRQDIRNDVSVIVGRGDQLRERVEPADEPALEALLDAAEHVVDLTDTAAELIDVLSVDDLEREPRDLRSVLDATVERFQRDSDATITLERYDASDDPVTVYASPMLGSVFDHLLRNAVEHSDRSTPRATVTLDVCGDRATVEIADDGVGIPDTQKALLVDPTARFDDRSAMGIGLYLVTTVLEEIGGELTIEDNHPRGTTVTVTLERVRGA